MTLVKSLKNQGNGILFLSLIALVFAPHDYKWPCGIGLYSILILAAVIDYKARTRRVTHKRRVASCGHVKAKGIISHIQVPQMLHANCTVCDAIAS